MTASKERAADQHPSQQVGGTILVVMMEVDEGHEEAFNRWYDDEHLPERLEIPGYVSARRFKLQEGEGVLQYLCIWELEDASPLESEMYLAQRARPSKLREAAAPHIRQRARGLYQQIFPPPALSKTTPGTIPTPRVNGAASGRGPQPA